jgi:hypothetical protein
MKLRHKRRGPDRRFRGPDRIDPFLLLRIDPAEPVVITPRGVKIPIVWLERSELGIHGLAEHIDTIESL